MTRAVSGKISKRRHKKVLKLAKGYRGRSNCFRLANNRVEKALSYSYRDRRKKKSTFRSLWITRISGAIRSLDIGFTYSTFINALKSARIEINRQQLSEIAFNDMDLFAKIANKAKESIPS